VVTEHTLSQSIKDLRQGLADDAKNPRFIKTLPKRSFQWLVEMVDAPTVVADKWQDSDQQRLQFYRNAASNQQLKPLSEVANPYLLMIAYMF
jgi:DNA-binding winged helix-turn-helix (wHTH) protein